MKKNNFLNKRAFTFVELMVVITVMTILSTIAYLSFSSYLVGVKDSNRINQVQSIADGIDLYLSKGYNIEPEDAIEIKIKGVGDSSYKTYATQGYAGKSVLDKIDYSSEGVDPKDKDYFIYSVDSGNKYIEILTYLEDEDNFPEDYTSSGATNSEGRLPFVYGKARVGVFLDENNEPLNESKSGTVEIDCNTSNTGIKLLLDNGEIIYPIEEQTLYEYGPCYSEPAPACQDQPSYTNAFFTEGNPTMANQPRIKGDPDEPCSYECLNNYTGIYCQNEPAYECATNPGYAHAVYTIGTPTYDNTIRQNLDSTAPCYYECESDYDGTTCANYIGTYSCAQIETLLLHATYTAGTPTEDLQAWQNTDSTAPCYYECTDGYTGDSCSTSPSSLPSTLEEALVNVCGVSQSVFNTSYNSGVYNGDIDCANKGILDAHLSGGFYELKIVNGSFDLSNNDIESLSGLSSLTSVTGDFDLSNNEISDISQVASFNTIGHIDLSNNKVDSVSEFSGLTNISYLDLSYNDISSVSALTSVNSLNYLYLNDNSISGTVSISGISSLKELDLGNNGITDISGITSLTNLTTLNLNDNDIASIPDDFDNFSNLNYLNLENNDSLGNISYDFDYNSSSLTQNGISSSGDNVTIYGNGGQIKIDIEATPVCDTNPGYVNATYTTGSPTSYLQSRQNTNSSEPCYYECINRYTGNDCSTAPYVSSSNIASTADITATASTIRGLTGTGGIANGVISTSGYLDYEYHSNTGNAFIKFDFSSQRAIGKIKIYNRTSCCTYRLSSSTIKFYDDGGILIYTYTLGDVDGEYIIDIDLVDLGNIYEAKTLLLETTSGNYINLREIEIYGVN